MEALIPVATSGGPTMFARIGVMRALNCHVEVRSMLAFVFRLVYQLFCRKYFAVLPKYRRLHDRWASRATAHPARLRESPGAGSVCGHCRSVPAAARGAGAA